ncbi:basic phospholipase A2 Drk-b2-like isoform X5 [Dreissena polymorpha]|nr:basic phospholipase A2 Drk-b2-like isoform X4 [Dreissena polymorpha]XP_052236840.1 basic phospholipase A2 Drk-b2-like isoform X5 [Dreissena polymorpha]
MKARVIFAAVFVVCVVGTADSRRVKRRLDEFGEMILLTTSRNPMDFNGYGNWCGYGGSGDTADAIDECCKTHDTCYVDLNLKDCETLLKYRIYTTEYEWSYREGEIICNDKDPCAKKLCECDRACAKCFGNNEHVYSPAKKHNALLFGLKRLIPTG